MNRIKELSKRWLSAFMDAKRLPGLFYLFRYAAHWRQYQRLSGQKLKFSQSYPCLTDWVTTTPFDAHYFYQAAWLARAISCRQRTGRHVDVGSDVRMIGVLSAFVEVEFVDFRPLQVSLPGLRCVAGDITNLLYDSESLDSISCLHVIEHIGLGRYGDPLDVNGSHKALAELVRLVKPGGYIFISVPVGRETVCFNAHRVFDPTTIVDGLAPLELCSLSLVTDSGEYIETASIEAARQQVYGCGMFVFRR
jgi:SAM-dependent methyltransferase